MATGSACVRASRRAAEPVAARVTPDGPVDYTDYDTRYAAYTLIVESADVVAEAEGPSRMASGPGGGGLRVLLALWNEGVPPQWTLPGGGVDFEETAEQGAVREAREETGFDVVLGRLLGVDSFVVPAARRHRDTARPLKAVRVVYTARISGGVLTRELDGTTDEARWWPVDAVTGLPRITLVDTALRWWRQAGSPVSW